MRVKQVWFTNDFGVDYSLCIRMEPEPCLILKSLIMSTNIFPPIEPVDGKKLSMDEAKKLGLDESHHVISSFDEESLMLLREAIDKVLNG